MKAFAGRDRDWNDVETVLIRQGDRLNLKQIMAELKPLAELKEASYSVGHLEMLIEKVKAQK